MSRFIIVNPSIPKTRGRPQGTGVPATQGPNAHAGQFTSSDLLPPANPLIVPVADYITNSAIAPAPRPIIEPDTEPDDQSYTPMDIDDPTPSSYQIDSSSTSSQPPNPDPGNEQTITDLDDDNEFDGTGLGCEEGDEEGA